MIYCYTHIIKMNPGVWDDAFIKYQSRLHILVL